MKYILRQVLVLLAVAAGACESLKITVNPLFPTGLRACIKNGPGVEKFELMWRVQVHGSPREPGPQPQHYGEVDRPANGLWCVLDKEVRLRAGDDLHYYGIAHRNGSMEQSKNHTKTLQVGDFLDLSGIYILPPDPNDPSPCDNAHSTACILVDWKNKFKSTTERTLKIYSTTNPTKDVNVKNETLPKSGMKAEDQVLSLALPLEIKNVSYHENTRFVSKSDDTPSLNSFMRRFFFVEEESTEKTLKTKSFQENIHLPPKISTNSSQSPDGALRSVGSGFSSPPPGFTSLHFPSPPVISNPPPGYTPPHFPLPPAISSSPPTAKELVTTGTPQPTTRRTWWGRDASKSMNSRTPISRQSPILTQSPTSDSPKQILEEKNIDNDDDYAAAKTYFMINPEFNVNSHKTVFQEIPPQHSNEKTQTKTISHELQLNSSVVDNFPNSRNSCEHYLKSAKKSIDSLISNLDQSSRHAKALESELEKRMSELENYKLVLRETFLIIATRTQEKTNILILSSKEPIEDYKIQLHFIIQQNLDIHSSRYDIMESKQIDTKTVMFQLGNYSEKLLIFLTSKTKPSRKYDILDVDYKEKV